MTEKQRAALDEGRKTFQKGEQRTIALSKKGNENSVTARQERAQRRTFAQDLAEALDIVTSKGETRKQQIARGLVDALLLELEKKRPDGKKVVALFVTIRDTIGEMPSQKVDVNASGNITVGNWRDVLKDKKTGEAPEEE